MIKPTYPALKETPLEAPYLMNTMISRQDVSGSIRPDEKPSPFLEGDIYIWYIATPEKVEQDFAIIC